MESWKVINLSTFEPANPLMQAMSASVPFGSWVRQRRKELGIPQQDLADHIGCSLVTLQKIESGKRRPSRQIALLLADYLKVPADERAAFVTFARTSQESTGSAGEEANEQAPWRAARLRHTNLPDLLAPLIGREQEQSALSDLLSQPRARLVTLAGPPGIGKTRLALEVASTLADHFEDGTFLVDLAPVSDPDLVIPVIARTLDLREAGDEAISTVLNKHLHNKRMLLLLDNFEQVLDAAPAVVTLLQANPWLKVFVTSREALHVHGERHFALPPLELPDLEHAPTLEALARNPCVQLLVEQAKAINPHFALTQENAEDMAAICISLDGLPLAIGLAASAVALSPKQARGALSNRLALLRTGARDLPPRQRTLRKAIEWSYGLLGPEEQTLFRRLGVFVAGFTPSAAEAIAEVAGNELPELGDAQQPARSLDNSLLATRNPTLAEGLSSLLHKNLLRHEEGSDGEPRLRMLETIREFAAERLATLGQEKAIQRIHARYYLGFAEALQKELAGPAQLTSLQQFEKEHDNLRAALSWALEHVDEPSEGRENIEIGLRLGGSLWHFWHLRGYLSEGRERLEAVLAASSAPAKSSSGAATDSDSEYVQARAWVLHGLSRLAHAQGDNAASRSVGSESLVSFKQVGDRIGIAAALSNLGVLDNIEGNFASSRMLHDESLVMRRDLGDRAGIASSLAHLGGVAFVQGDFATAHNLIEESLAIRRELGDHAGIAAMLADSARVAWSRGDFKSARALYEEGLSMQRKLGDKRGLSYTLAHLGFLNYQQEDYTAARTLYIEGLAVQRELGDKMGIAHSLSNLGCIAWLQGDYASARALHEECLAMQREFGHTLGVAYSLVNLGHAVEWQGDVEWAHDLYIQSLKLGYELGINYCVVACLAALGGLSVKQGQAMRAARLLGTAEALLEAAGAAWEVDDRIIHVEGAAIARAQLGDPAFEEAWIEGSAFTMEQAIAYALDIPDKEQSDGSQTSNSTKLGS